MARYIRRDVSAIAFLAFVLTLLLPTFAERGANVALAAEGGCPQTLLLETTNDKHYVAVFGASTATSTKIQMTLFTQNGAYALSQSAVAIATPSDRTGAMAFRSAPFIIGNPSKDRFLAAAVNFVPDGGAMSCAPVHRIIASAEMWNKQQFGVEDATLRGSGREGSERVEFGNRTGRYFGKRIATAL